MSDRVIPDLSDTIDIPEYFLSVLDCAKTDVEKQLSSALWFHLDVLNGGFSQAFSNKKGRVEEAIFAYKKIGVTPAPTIISRAYSISRQPLKLKKFRLAEIKALENVYVAMTYNLPYACSDYQNDPEFQTDDSDWIIRLALKFARKNIDKIPNFVNALASEDL